MKSAGLGAQGNQGLASGIYNTGSNISQLQQNQGNARAGGAANSSGIVSNLLGKVPWGSVANTVGGWLGSGSTGDTGTGGVGYGDLTGGNYNGGAFDGGAPLYDPSTGGYPGADTYAGSMGQDWFNTNPS